MLAEKKAADTRISELQEELEQLKRAKASVESKRAQLEGEVAKLTKSLDDEVRLVSVVAKLRWL